MTEEIEGTIWYGPPIGLGPPGTPREIRGAGRQPQLLRLSRPGD
jgi:hypothetical protein